MFFGFFNSQFVKKIEITDVQEYFDGIISGVAQEVHYNLL